MKAGWAHAFFRPKLWCMTQITCNFICLRPPSGTYPAHKYDISGFHCSRTSPSLDIDIKLSRYLLSNRYKTTEQTEQPPIFFFYYLILFKLQLQFWQGWQQLQNSLLVCKWSVWNGCFCVSCITHSVCWNIILFYQPDIHALSNFFFLRSLVQTSGKTDKWTSVLCFPTVSAVL